MVATFVAAPLVVAVSTQRDDGLDDDARRWVDDTIGQMSLDEKIGQLLLPSFYSVFTSSDSETYDELTMLVHEYHVGGLHVFGARTPRPAVLLNPNYARTALGEPLNASWRCAARWRRRKR